MPICRTTRAARGGGGGVALGRVLLARRGSRIGMWSSPSPRAGCGVGGDEDEHDDEDQDNNEDEDNDNDKEKDLGPVGASRSLRPS